MREDLAPSPLPLGTWRLWRPLALVAIGLVLPTAAPLLATVVVGLVGDPQGPARPLIEKAILLLLPLVLVLPLLAPLGRRVAGLARPSVRKFLLWGVGATLLLNLASILWDRHIDARPMGAQLKEMGFGTTANSLLLILAIVILPPVAEELIFRAGFQRGLRDTVGRFAPRWVASALAIAASSWLFMSIHGDPDQVQLGWVYLLFGVLTALAYEVTGSLLTAVVIHSATNAYAVVSGSLDGSAPALANPIVITAAVLAPLVALALTWAIGRLLPATVSGRTRSS